MDAAHHKARPVRSENIDQSKPAAIIVGKGGGLTNFARDYDFPISTVFSWMEGGLIPSRYRDDKPELGEKISYSAWILHRSEQLGHGITPDDFIEQQQPTGNEPLAAAG